MPRKPVLQDFWSPYVYELLANEPELNNRDIADRLSQKMTHDPERFIAAPEVPSERTIARIRQNAPLEEVREYRYFRWPESMGTPDLPWGAAPVCLWLLREFQALAAAVPGHVSERPTNRLAKWFWRVWQAAPTSDFTSMPDANFKWRWDLAVTLASTEIVTVDLEHRTQRGIEGVLVYAPWSSPTAGLAWRKAVLEGRIPDLRTYGLSSDAEKWKAVVEGGLPEETAERWKQSDSPKEENHA